MHNYLVFFRLITEPAINNPYYSVWQGIVSRYDISANPTQKVIRLYATKRDWVVYQFNQTFKEIPNG